MHCRGYVENLAVAAEDPDFEALAAGLLAVRAAEDFLDGKADDQQVAAARDAAAQLTHFPAKSRLVSILSRIDPHVPPTEGRRDCDVSRALLAFGNDLHNTGRLMAAVDVFGVVAGQFRGDSSTRIEALQSQAYSLRMLRRWEEAAISYSMMHSLALQRGDVRMELEAEMGPAYLEIERGVDIDRVLNIVRRVLRRARFAGVKEVIAKALTARAYISGTRKDPVGVIVDTYEALDYLSERTLRDHNLMNLAVAFREVGHAEASTIIAEHLSVAAQDVYVRSLATLHRLHLAIDERDDQGISRVCAQLDTLPKQAQIEFSYHEAIARAHAAAGRFAAAENEGLNALIVAKASGLGDHANRAETALRDIRRRIVPAIYEFRPIETTMAAQRKLTAIAKDARAMCAA